MKIIEEYTKDIIFNIITIGIYIVILSILWLYLYNPKIDWTRGNITIS
jgi:hypothetical protein